MCRKKWGKFSFCPFYLCARGGSKYNFSTQVLCIGSKCGTSQCTNTIHKSSRIPKLHLYRCYIQIRDPKAKKSSSVQSNITSRLLAQAFSTYLHSGMACKILSKARAQDRCLSSTRGKRRKKAKSVPTTIARQSATLFEGLGISCYNLRFWISIPGEISCDNTIS